MIKKDTNEDVLLEKARSSGLSYNEAIEWMTKNTGGHNTSIYSDTNVKAVKKQNQQSQHNNTSIQ